MKQAWEEWEKLLKVPVIKVEKYRKNWLLQTKMGKWIAKRLWDREHMRWWSLVDDELRQRGFTAMPAMISDYKRWVITPYIPGKTCNYSSIVEVKQAISVLAQFHVTGRNLQTPPRQAAFLFFHRLYERLQEFYHLVKRAGNISGPLGEILQKEGVWWYQMGERVWQKVLASPLCEWTMQDASHRCLTHRDLASHNWLIGEDGKVWLIDFDTADYDLQLGDLWQMMTRVFTLNQWNEQICLDVIRQYERIRPLAKREKQMLILLMHYPNELYREAIGLALNKPGYKWEYSFPYIQRIVSQRPLWLCTLERLSFW
jgi:CotS family spore coat protein